MGNNSALIATKTVFVVDDHPLIRDWLSRLIAEEKDLEVCGTADSAETALVAIGQLNPTIVIVDIGLHGKSGLELVKELTNRDPEKLILMLSMHDEAIYAQRALKAGARGYVGKRETTERVVQAIRRILDGGIYVSERIAESLAAGLRGNKSHSSDQVSILSDRELEVFRLLGTGRQTVEIARTVGVSLKTIQTYYSRIKSKLDCRNHSELIQAATRWLDAQHNT